MLSYFYSTTVDMGDFHLHQSNILTQYLDFWVLFTTRTKELISKYIQCPSKRYNWLQWSKICICCNAGSITDVSQWRETFRETDHSVPPRHRKQCWKENKQRWWRELWTYAFPLEFISKMLAYFHISKEDRKKSHRAAPCRTSTVWFICTYTHSLGGINLLETAWFSEGDTNKHKQTWLAHHD